MDKFRAQEPTRLQGKATISDVRNAALPIFFAALLAEELIEIQNVPKLKDIGASMKLPSQLGAKVERNGSVCIDARDINVFCVPYDLAKAIRASIWAPGPLIAHSGQGQVLLPGGCTTSTHPADLHIPDLEQSGVTIKLGEGCVKAFVGGRLKGVHIVMDKVSVSAMVTIVCTATLAESATIAEDTVRESEIIDAANFLITLGVKISGQGIDRIVIKDVERLGGNVYHALPDRIETGTFLVAAAIFRDKIICCSTQPDTPDVVLAKLRNAGAGIEAGEDWTSLDIHGKRPRVASVHTTPYPAFPTDMQAQLMLSNLVVERTGSTTETVLENRPMHVPGLSRMGAHVEIESSTVTCHGVGKLSGTQAMVTDLRTLTSLVLADCTAEGTIVVDRTYHIDRGHERIEDKLRALGADVECVKDE